MVQVVVEAEGKTTEKTEGHGDLPKAWLYASSHSLCLAGQVNAQQENSPDFMVTTFFRLSQAGLTNSSYNQG